MSKKYITVIGLEVHVQLKTKSKLFCSCSTDYIGAMPNSNVCPVCLGLPGTLPVLNKKAVELALKMSCAIGGNIQKESRFHRKNYFYPDLPKAYQISQYDRPISFGGKIPIKTEQGEKFIGITRLHLEEDAGKLVHATLDGRLHGSGASYVDYNRAGVPLIEIVSEPQISTPEEAKEYVLALRKLVRYLGVSDGDMESGSMRVDANISLNEEGQPLGVKVEIKNMNSLRALQRALEYEQKRQKELLMSGGTVVQETRHWDDAKGITVSSRSKEEAHDYRYFPDPDLPLVVVSEEMVEEVASSIPELPWEKKERYMFEFSISEEEAEILTSQIELARYFEDALSFGAPVKPLVNWMKTEVIRSNKEGKFNLENPEIEAQTLAKLIKLLDEKKISNTAGKDLWQIMLDKKVGLEEAMKDAGIAVGGIDDQKLEEIVDKILKQNQDVVKEILEGKDTKGKKIKFLMGLVMRETRGQAKPQMVEDMLKSKIGQ